MIFVIKNLTAVYIMWEPLIYGSNPYFPTILMERWLSGLKQRLAKASVDIGPQVRILPSPRIIRKEIIYGR